MHYKNDRIEWVLLVPLYVRALTETVEKESMTKRKCRTLLFHSMCVYAHYFSDHNELKYPNVMGQKIIRVWMFAPITHLYVSLFHVCAWKWIKILQQKWFIFWDILWKMMEFFHVLSHFTIQTHHWLNKSILLCCGKKQLKSPNHVCASCIEIRWNENKAMDSFSQTCFGKITFSFRLVMLL